MEPGETIKLYCEAGSPNASPNWGQATAPSPSHSPSGNSSGGVSIGTVVGAAVGGAAALAALALAVVFCFRKRRRQHLQQQVETGVSTSLDDEKLEATAQHPDPPPPPFSGKGDGDSIAAAPVDPADGYQGFGTDSTEGGNQGGTGKGWSDAMVSAGGPLAAAAAFAAANKPGQPAAPEAAPEAGDSVDDFIRNPEQQTLNMQYQQYQEAQYQQSQGAEASVLSTYPTRPPGGPPASALSLMGGNHANTQQLPQQQQVQQQQADWQQQQQHHAQQQQADGLGAAANQAASLPRSEASTGPPATPDPMAAPYLSAASAATTTATLNTASSSTPSTAAALLSEDPILTYINTKLPTTLQGTSASAPAPPAIPGAAPAPRRAISALAATPGGGVVDAGSWEVSFQELSIVKPIGEGSFGRVYLALWNQTSVAVKILIDREAIHREQARGGEESTALMLPPELQAKLDEEAGLMARMRHPHVVSFLGVCRTPPCLLTEYCSRGSLSNVLARARRDTTLAAQLTWHRRLHMALDAALGMLYLHTRQPPIVHRDLKSPNLLVDEWWRVKVSDFNLSRILEEGGRSSSLAAMNPRWLAPEVMRGGRATQPADVFAFGVIMWELLTWHLPWTSSEVSGWQLVNLVMNGARLEVPQREKLPGPGPLPAAELDTYVALMRGCWAEEALARPSFAEVTVRLRELAEQAADSDLQP